MFTLPRGATGFFRPEDGPLPVLTGEQLATPLSRVDTSALSRHEWRQVRLYGVGTLGGVLFNAWD
ncbi:hypothetical protein LE181_24570 [Streptomyces sp. SCA3-4]|uniref:hypothetical protein n=1 Tax=Streptomyces sichuanensis TaxID=2871810 RepID=UPI001CE33B0D|nr:hypothetical protein [Streptomyces sichuanensis]MCA6095327.1 hypothetical protein [Streptomyces sichuanensis]